MKVIQELVAHFERQNKLSAEELKALLDQGLLASEAPSRIQDLCDTPGATFSSASTAPMSLRAARSSSLSVPSMNTASRPAPSGSCGVQAGQTARRGRRVATHTRG